MIKSILHTIGFLLIFNSVFAQQKQNTIFKFQLNHIDIAVDSVTLHSLMNNKFITDTFSSTKLFRDCTGTEFLMRGQDHWLHFLTDKGCLCCENKFFKNRLGAIVLVHHSFTWKETDNLLKYLQSFTKDSLYNRPYRSADLNIDYINIYEDLSDSLWVLKLIPILQNHSKKDYLSWGYTETDLQNGITQKKWMQDYVGKETSDKLFKSIESIKMTASRDELRRIPPLMRGYGYRRQGKKYLLDGSPAVVVTPLKKAHRRIAVHMKLTKSVPKRSIRLSDNALLSLEGNDAWFHYSVFDQLRWKG
jgi:hypothetical protein